jgi:hypothetical protein
VAVTERTSRADIDRLAESLGRAIEASRVDSVAAGQKRSADPNEVAR